MAPGLTEYLTDAARKPFQWGSADCATFVLEWFDRLSTATRAHLWAGAYDSEETCAAWCAEQGGYSAIADAFLGGWYGARRAEPKAGNAVLVNFRGTEMMGIRVDDHNIALKSLRVMITKRATPLIEWSI